MALLQARRAWRLALLALCLAGVPAVATAADAVAGQSAYAVCSACHGAQGEGNQAMNAPRLAGQSGWYLRRQIAAYQRGWRGTAPGDVYGMQMRPMAMAIGSTEALDTLIAYGETLPDVPAAPTIQGDPAAGQAAYAVCVACHGADGRGNEQLGGPALAGQSDWYLARQLANYRQGLRGYVPQDSYGMQMKPMAATLASDAAVNDVVAYINSLR